MNLQRVPFLFLFLAMMLFYGCNPTGQNGEESLSTDVVKNPNTANGNPDQGTLPVIQFEETEHDFGQIIEGETVSFSFKFTNAGKTDLIIAEVSSSCGCTVPSYPKTPIRSGETGTIKVAFNSNGRRGYQNKNVVVISNTQPNATVIRIKAQVVNPATEK
jgi:hypothetical protein